MQRWHSLTRDVGGRRGNSISPSVLIVNYSISSDVVGQEIKWPMLVQSVLLLRAGRTRGNAVNCPSNHPIMESA